MTKILQTWTKLKTKFKNTLGDKQERIRLLMDKSVGIEKALRELEWEKRWLERWELLQKDERGQLKRYLADVFNGSVKFELEIDFSSPSPVYLPSFWEFKKLIALLREHYCREELKIKI